MTKKILIFIATYNENQNISDLLYSIIKISPDYDVLIIDIRMTVKDGYEVISFLEGLNNTIPIVVVSACIAYATPDELSKLGDVLIIRKPILTSTLRERIVKYIN